MVANDAPMNPSRVFCDNLIKRGVTKEKPKEICSNIIDDDKCCWKKKPTIPCVKKIITKISTNINKFPLIEVVKEGYSSQRE